MNQLELTDTLNKPYAISYSLSEFYAKSVGKVLDYNKEHVMLLDWQEAINDCDKLARNLRDRHTMRDMAAFRAELLILLECNTAK